MDIVFKRKIYDKLLKWKKEDKGSCALLIEGARRVGKSTIAEAFAKANYRSYILIDFRTASKDIKQNFVENVNPINLNRFFQRLSILTSVDLYPRESLIILDEIQRFPKARECIKDLVKDGRYDYIETGSLISIKENVDGITIPSEERKVKMYPLDFEEYLWARGRRPLAEAIKQAFHDKIPFDSSLHKEAKNLFKEYMIVGGMPQSVLAYLSSNESFAKADSAKRLILSLYRDDIKKADKRYRLKAGRLFEGIPGFLSRHDKEVVLDRIDGNATFYDYADAFYWLGDSMMTNNCYRCTDPSLALALNRKDSSVKCYMGDTGLLISAAFSAGVSNNEEVYKKLLKDQLSVNEGMLFENVIAQSVACSGNDLYFYAHRNEKTHQNDIEVDFLLTDGSLSTSKVVPIEVKSSRNYTTISYSRFFASFPKRIGEGYVVHPKQFKIEGGTTYLPCYMFFCLFEEQ